jgi:hypothetical protein
MKTSPVEANIFSRALSP